MKPVNGIEIRALLPDEDIHIVTDATRLKQVICNLINNAGSLPRKDIFISDL